MKRKITVVIMLALILISTLSMAGAVNTSSANNNRNINEDSLEEIRKTNPLDSIATSSQPSSIDQSRRSDFRINPDAEVSEHTRESLQKSLDKWNFNDTSNWSSSAYFHDNKTRLIVGVNGREAENFRFEQIVNKHRAKIANTVKFGDTTKAVVVELPLDSVTPFVEDVRNAGLASYIEPNMRVQTQLYPNDPYWDSQWGPQKIEADWAWNTTIGDSSVLVAVVDTGIAYNHPDIAANYVPLGYDWVNLDSDPMDDHGHGTHCSGIIAGVLNNSEGIAGLAQVRVMGEKVLDSGGSGYWDWVANGIAHAADSGADIISMSLGGYGDSELVHDAVKYAYAAGVLIIAAAGNSDTNVKMYPAGYDEVVAVAATDQNDNKASFSNWGDWIELAAPGVDILSTVPWGYESWSGTSMACPHVSGVAALVWSLNPGKTRDWVRLWLRYTADDLGDAGFDEYYGYGRVNARKAAEQAPPTHELIASGWETPPYVKPGSSKTINATLLNFGENNETGVIVQLSANETVVDSVIIDSFTSGNLTTVSLVWAPLIEGLYNVTLYIVPVPGETSIENNLLWKNIFVGSLLKAVVLHSAGNIESNSIITWQTLNTEWYQFGSTMIYIDYTTLNKDDITYENIAATEADVLIISCAYDPYIGWQFTDSEIEAIRQYVYEGHGLIVTAGTFYYMVPNNYKFAPFFGLSEDIMCDTVGTDLLHVINASHPLFKVVPNPLVIPPVGTAIPYDWQWDSNEIVDGKYLALGHYQESAIVARRGLVYISPWLEVIPPYYHHHLQLLYNAITWSRYERPEHELVVSVDAPKHLNPNETAILNATVVNKGRNNETNVELQLLINGLLVDSTTILELTIDSSYSLSYSWTPTVQGTYNITAYAPPVPSEEYVENNIANKQVAVLLIAVKSVLVYTDDYAVAPSARYVIVALENLGITYTHFADNPPGFIAALTSQPWDLVIVDHCNYYEIGNYWTELEQYVHDGGFLIISTFDVDGSNSEFTTLWDTMGARWVSDMWSPEPVYRWLPTHPIFTFPNTLGDLTAYSEGYWDDGDHVTAITGTSIAGFAPSDIKEYGGIVVGNDYPTILFSFLLDEFRYDQDGDNKFDAIELWENAIVYLARGYEHEVAVTLKAPEYAEPGESVLLNATIKNRGSSNETDSELQLLINGTIVDSVLIPELQTGSSYTLSYLWTPATEGTYNITAYVPLLPDEEYTANNIATAIVKVRYVKGIILFDQIHGTDLILWYSIWVTDLIERGYIVETLTSGSISSMTLETCDVLVIPQAYSDYSSEELSAIQNFVMDGGGLLIVGDDNPSIYTKLTSFAGINWDYYSWSGIATDITEHPVTEEVVSVSFGAALSRLYVSETAQELIRDDYHSILLAVSEFGRGKVLGIGDEDTIADWSIMSADNLRLANNMIDWLITPPPEHDLAVILKAPDRVRLGESVQLNATIMNRGLSNETNVELQLLINGTVVDFVMIQELPSGQLYELTYTWTPVIEGIYNVTAYAPPVLNEEYIANNFKTKTVSVSYIIVALISDSSHLMSITNILDSMKIGYDIYNDNSFHLYTEDLTLLLNYKIVIFYNYDRMITSSEHLALQSYLDAGGNLIVTGYDSLGHPDDPLLADIVRSSSFGDHVGQPDLIVIDSGHPIMNGPYGSFPEGYHITGLSSDNDYAEADTTRNALTVAELASQCDKIIATEGIPGKVVYWNGEGSYDWVSNADCQIMFCNMIEWMRLKGEHDLAVSLKVPPSVEPGATTVIEATVFNKGLSKETNVELQLLIDSTVVDSEVISELLSGSSYRITYPWTPISEGIYNITTYAPLVINETYVGNNMMTKMVVVALYPMPTDRPVVYIYPPVQALAPDQTFTITVYIFNLTDATISDPINPLIIYPLGNLFGLDIIFSWDPTVLEYVNHTVTIPVETYPTGVLHSPILPVLDEVNETAGTYQFAVTSMFPAEEFNNPGQHNTIFSITLKTKTVGTSALKLQNVDLASSDYKSIPHYRRDYNQGGIFVPSGAPWDPSLDPSHADGEVYIVEMPEVHDVAILNVTAAPASVYADRIVSITVVVANLGNATETFDVTLYANTTILKSQTITGLDPGENSIFTYGWNTTGLAPTSNFTIWAETSIILGDIDPTNNLFTDGYVYIKQFGDINGDGEIDLYDIMLAIAAYGSKPGDARWNPDADIAPQYGKIDIYDLITLICLYKP